MVTDKKIWINIALVLFWMWLHLGLTWYFLPHTTDDAFIFFRYAQNWANGAGPVWNIGDVPVEGFSSPLWLYLLTLAHALGFTIPIFAKLAGVVFSFFAVVGVGLLARELGHKGTEVGVMIGASLCIGLHYWAPTGMETSLYTFLWVASLLTLFRGTGVWAPALLGVARPEGLLIALLWCFCDAALDGKISWRKYIWVVLPSIVWLAFRLYVYGDIFPNTYYAKMGADTIERLQYGLQYIQWPLMVWGVAVGFALFEKDRQAAALLLLLGGQLLAIAWGGGDWMAWGRMLVPVVIPLWAWLRFSKSYESVLGIACLVFLAQMWIPFGAVKAMLQGKRMPTRGFQEGQLIAASQVVAQHIRTELPAGSLIAVNHAGALPYYLPDYHFVDMTGLNDWHIAHQVAGKMHAKYDPNYVLGRRPSGIIMNSRVRPGTNNQLLHPNYWIGERVLAEHPIFHAEYQPVQQYWERQQKGGGAAFMMLYTRR